MDSVNSGSLQSSSGADEECDSRAAVIPTHHQPHPPPFNHHMFDQNQINNHHPLFFSPSPQHQLLNLDLPSFSAHTVPFSPATTVTTTAPPTGARNPKKRSRASRRAPTTVLTTDTSNFRAMVQEFTGIPAPPFTSSSLTTSFDLFGRSNINNNFDNLPQLPSYLIRPFSQKLQYSSASSISSLMDSSILLTTMQNTASFPSNSLNQSSFLHPRTTENVVSSNGYGVIHELYNSLPDLVSTSKGTADRPTIITTRSHDGQVASGNWDGGGSGGGGGRSGVDYADGKKSSSRVITDHHHSSGGYGL